jgi:hypothetical protein
MMSSSGLYYNYCMLVPFGYKLRTNLSTNALKDVLLELVYSSFLSFISSFQDIKSQKCTKLF